MAIRALFATLLALSHSAELAAAASSQDGADDAGVAGVQKVIQMLGDMSAKAKDEKKNEEVAFAEFQTWCKMQIPATKKSIAQGAEEIELLTADIDKLTNEAKVLGEEIAKLQSDVAGFEAEKKAKEIQREKDHKAFVEESTDYGESLSALDSAITVLMSKSADKPAQSAVLLQLARGNRLPENAKSMVAAFIGMMGGDFLKSMEEPGMGYSAPEANAYEFQSGGIVEMLEKPRMNSAANSVSARKKR
jgi:chromosome segregation ATPase